jgi:hypothetical protein
MILITGLGNKHSGYPKINLAHVAVFKPHNKNGEAFTDNGECFGYECFTASGESLGTISADYLRTRTEEQGTIVPDLTGSNVILFEGDSHYSRFPVLAWRVLWFTDYYVDPIISCGAIGNVQCIEHKGLWEFQNDHNFDTFEEALAHGNALCGEAEERYARSQQLKATSAE